MREFFVSEEIEKPALAEGAERFLEDTRALDIELEARVNGRFGEGFIDTLRLGASGYLEKLLEKGENALETLEEKGFPLPQSKLGSRLLAGATGVAGIAVPGLGVLLPVSYLLWKRGDRSSKESPYVS